MKRQPLAQKCQKSKNSDHRETYLTNDLIRLHITIYSQIIKKINLLNFCCCRPEKLDVSGAHDLLVLLQGLLGVVLFRKQNESVACRSSV
jgi:hypothetical protein